MKNPFKKYSYLKFFVNRYTFIFVFFSVWILFLDDASYLRHRALNKETKTLKTNIKFYQKEILKDQKQIKELKNMEEIERYAREKYYMKKPNEDVYIIGYENDTIDQ